MNFRNAIELVLYGSIGSALGLGIVDANASEKWMLMSRHGECAELESLKRKLPNMPNISEMSSLIDFFKSEGYSVESKLFPNTKNGAYQIDVPDLSLNLMLVRESFCETMVTRD